MPIYTYNFHLQNHTTDTYVIKKTSIKGQEDI